MILEGISINNLIFSPSHSEFVLSHTLYKVQESIVNVKIMDLQILMVLHTFSTPEYENAASVMACVCMYVFMYTYT
jgi:hypothetical protein